MPYVGNCFVRVALASDDAALVDSRNGRSHAAMVGLSQMVVLRSCIYR